MNGEAHGTEQLSSLIGVQARILLFMGKPLWSTAHTRREGVGL